MTKLLLGVVGLIFVLLLPANADARARHSGYHQSQHVTHVRHYKRYGHRRMVRHRYFHRSVDVGSRASNIVTVGTAAGPINVASHLAGTFQSLISAFAAAGYHPRAVSCHASGGHVRGSRHYPGAACDFEGKNKSAFMRSRTAAAIIMQHGLRNGCSFRDCGHVDDGQRLGSGLRSSRFQFVGSGQHYAQRSWERRLCDGDPPRC